MAPQNPAESWDDDTDLQGNIFFTNNRSTVKTSISSRQSLRSESDAGDKDWQLPLNLNDQTSKSQAISTATQAGIPLPKDIPASALLGGSIKRLGKKTSRHDIEDDWGNDLQLPDSGSSPLKLKTPQRSPAQNIDHDDFEDWAEGSLGIRTGGTRHDAKNRSSSVSAMSPSMGSVNTAESEEDGLAGLEIPTGPVNFQAALKKRQEVEARTSPESKGIKRDLPVTPTESAPSHKEDFFADIDFGAGDVFDPKKRPVNRNVKQHFKPTNTSSPLNRPQATLTFSERAAATRLPRPVSMTKPSRLEPVLEPGATNITRPRNSESLKAKRSAPALRPARSQLTKQPSVPSLPSTGFPSQPNYTKPTRAQPHTRFNSDPERSTSPIPRPSIRPLSQVAPDTPTRPKRDASTSLAREAANKRTVTKPARRRNFGDGSELDLFDDLPTSATKEKQYTKQPTMRQPGGTLRHTTSRRQLIPSREKAATPMPPPPTPKSPTKVPDNLPRFARDTAASRIAREQTLGGNGPAPNRRPESVLATRTNWQAQVAARSPHSSPTANRVRKGPTLINPMGKENAKHCKSTVLPAEESTNGMSFHLVQDDAARKGMHWNQSALRWEGNDVALQSFSPPPPASPPRPALITNMNPSGPGGIQVHGGMVFDPQRMCWLKVGKRDRTNSNASMHQYQLPQQQRFPVSPSVDDEDEEDPFAGIEDLKDETYGVQRHSAVSAMGGATGSGADNAADPMSLDGGLLPVHEEFDLGPEFIRRQREEEGVWRSRVGLWFPEGTEVDWLKEREREGQSWKWEIRDIANQVDLMR